MNQVNSKTQKTGCIERLWIMLLLVLDLVNMKKRISERAAAMKKIGETALIAAGAVAGLAGIVFAVKLKRKIWPNSPNAVSNHGEED